MKNIYFDRNTVLLIFLSFSNIFNFTIAVNIERVSPVFELAEGPHWDVNTQKLYFVDIKAQKILRLDPASGKITSVYLKDGTVSVVVPIEGSEDQLVAGCGRNAVLVTWNGENDVIDPPTEKLVSLDTDRKDTRTNDGKCDSAGRFWVGTMAIEINKISTPNRGALYVVGSNASSKQVLSPVSISNGLTWSSQSDKMYYIDSPKYQIWGFDYNITTGSITNKTIIFDLKKNNVKGLPDGMTIDADDNLWIALNGAGEVMQINPISKKLLQKIKLPVDQITSVAFGGKELDILFVTTSYDNMSNEERDLKPESGSLFTIRNLGVKGVPPTNFKYNE